MRDSKMAAGEGDHMIVGDQIAPGVWPVTSFNEDGTSSEEGIISTQKGVVAGEGVGEPEPIMLEPCPDKRAVKGTCHVRPALGHRGPAYVRTDEYCEGWERTFGHRD